MKIITLILLFLITHIGDIPKNETYKNQEIKSLLPKGLKLDFKIANSNEVQAPVLRARIDGIDLLCIIDTGSNFDLLITDRFAKKLNAKRSKKHSIKINGDISDIEITEINDLTIFGYSNRQKIQLGDRDALITNSKSPIFNHIKYKGTQIDAIVSLNSQIESCILQFDYINNHLNVMNHSNEVDYSRCRKNSLKITNNLPYMNISAKNGINHEILFDTGAEHIALSVEPGFFGDVKSNIGTAYIKTFASESQVNCYMMSSLDIGELKFNNFMVAYQESLKNMKFGYNGMKNKVITIDIKKGFIYFEG